MFNSPGLDSFFQISQPRAHGGSVVFPHGVIPEDLRFSNGTTADWNLTEILTGKYADAVRTGLVEENLLVISRMNWRAGRIITYANIQVYVGQGVYEAFRVGAVQTEGQISYFRFDYHPKAAGRIMVEPIPHIHSLKSNEPRFSSRTDLASENPIVDFFEFIYRNYYPEKYESWIESISNTIQKSPQEDFLPILMNAFKAGQVEALPDKALVHLAMIKEKSIQAKNKFFGDPIKWSFSI